MALNPNRLESILRARAEDYIRENKLAWAEMAVNQAGKRLLTLRIGKQNISDTLHEEKPLYRIASMTKPVTAVALLQQWDKGKIDLDAPLSDYLPGYRTMMLGHVDGENLVLDGPATQPIKVFHLLTHTSGIDVMPLFPLIIRHHPGKTIADTVEYYSKMPLAFEPFTATGYSMSAGFDIAAHLVEMVSGEDYASYLKHHITDPLEMPDTTFAPTAEQESRIVGMHARTEEGEAVEVPMPKGCVIDSIPVSCCLAGGGLASTLEDYSKFAQMLLNGGVGDNGARVLSERAVANMSAAHVPASIMPGLESWGLGVRVVTSEEYPRGLAKGSFGWSGAYGSHFWVDPVNEITAVYMRNSLYDSGGCGGIGVQFEADVMSAME